MRDRSKLLATVAIWLILVSLPFWIGRVGGFVDLGTQIVILGLAAMSLNFLLGFTGVLSFGHAAYFGLAAYGLGMTIKYVEPNTLVGMAVGLSVGAVGAALVGALIIRLRGIYFAMVTIAFGQVFYFIALRWDSATGGDDGLSGWSPPPINLGFTRIDVTNDHAARYYVTLFFFAIAVAIMGWLLRSPFGRTLIAIRENERRARFLGVAVDRSIWISWTISCFFVSLAGTLYAILNTFAGPYDLRWEQSGNFVIMAVLGGMRSFWGPLIGAAIYVGLENFLSTKTQNWMSFIGLFFVLVVLFFPRGVLGIIKRRPAQ